MVSRAFRINATGAAFTGVGTGVMAGVHLTAAAAAATAVVREVDGSGAILAVLAAPVNGADRHELPTAFTTAVHVTLSGAGADCVVYIR